MGMKIAFWKGTDSGFSGVLDRSIRWWMSGKYSHCELIFSDGFTGSCSWAEDGVILLQREVGYYNPADWDLVEIEGDEAKAREWFIKHRGTPYDLLGDFGFVWRPIRGMDGAYFCSEAIAQALGWPNSWRYDPNLQADVLRIINSPQVVV